MFAETLNSFQCVASHYSTDVGNILHVIGSSLTVFPLKGHRNIFVKQSFSSFRRFDFETWTSPNL